jgi:hypothetical protein
LGAPDERIKLGLLCLLLLFMLGIVCFTAVGTYKAVRSFQQQNHALQAGDVSTIRDWMTIHAIARIYHVPEEYLSGTLAIANPDLLRHSTLNQLASQKRQPVDKLIQTLQRAIRNYRKTHHIAIRLSAPKPKPSQPGGKKPHVVKPPARLAQQSDTKSHLATTGRT